MNMVRTRMWKLAALSFLWLWLVGPSVPGPFAAQPGVITADLPADALSAVDTWEVRALDVLEQADGVVVTLDTRGTAHVETFVLENPPRFVLDLHGAVNRLDSYYHPVSAGDLRGIRVGQYRTDPYPITRVVLDLDTARAYPVLQLPSAIQVTVGPSSPATDRAPRVEPAMLESAPAPETDWVDDPDAHDETYPVEPPAGEPLVADVRHAAPPVPAAPAPRPAESRAVTSGARTPVEAPVEPDAAEPVPAAPVSSAPPPEPAPARAERAVPREALDALLNEPELAAPAERRVIGSTLPSFETKQIGEERPQYTGKKISLNLVDADIKQVFRLFHEISGLNFVLDPSVEGRVTIVLDRVPWDQALDIILKNNGLDKVVEGNVIRIAPTQKLAREAAERKQLRDAKELEVEPVTITRTLSYAKAKEVERVIREGGILTPRGKVIVDERTNTLIISDIPKKVDPIDALISTLDTETPQVMIEARIVETSREFVRDFGVQWGFNALADAAHGTSTGLSFPHNATARYGLNLGNSPSGDVSGINSIAFTFGNVVDSFTLDIALDALETEGRGRILSSPKIATQNNERAEIEQGVRIPVVNTTATEINVEFVSASLRLAVTPQITAEGTVILDIEVENNTPDFVNRVGDVPPINTQRAQTKVLINDGGTTVIGGIFTVNEGVSEVGVPWFRKLPVLGWLFKKRNITEQNRELLIFITPKIMKLG